jgi:hypothetical protein
MKFTLIVLIAAWLGPAATIHAQLDAGRISEALTNSAQKGASANTLWNLGFQYYNEYPPSAELCRTIGQGYQGAAGTKPEQDEILTKAAEYWGRRYESYGGDFDVSTRSVPRERRPEPYRGRWESTLPLKRSEGGGPIVTPRR